MLFGGEIVVMEHFKRVALGRVAAHTVADPDAAVIQHQLFMSGRETLIFQNSARDAWNFQQRYGLRCFFKCRLGFK